MKRILVFVKSEYVRDAQAFTRLDASQYEEVGIYMGTDCEQGWNDIKGPVLVADWKNLTMEQAMEKIKVLYPDASIGIFTFLIILLLNSVERDAFMVSLFS